MQCYHGYGHHWWWRHHYYRPYGWWGY
jgi:hypothetical protein